MTSIIYVGMDVHTTFMKKHREPLKRYGRKTAQGVWQPPDLCAVVTAWFRQRRNTHPRSAAGRIKRHSQTMAQ